MNKLQIILSLAIIYLLPNFGNAQSYVPLVVDSTHWFLEEPFMGPPPYDYIEYYLLGDTVVSSINYKKIYFRQELANNHNSMVSQYSLYALIREDTLARKVYAILLQNIRTSFLCPTNQELLIYDFSVQIGDTLKKDDLCIQMFDETISNVTANNYWINTYRYTFQSNTCDLYEGIGSSFGLLEPIFSSVSGPQHLLIDYCRGGLSNCKYYNVGIDSPSIDNDLKIYPNPTSNYLTIESNINYHTINIYNLSGRIVKTQNASMQISVLELPKGMYFIQLVADKNVITKKFTIE